MLFNPQQYCVATSLAEYNGKESFVFGQKDFLGILLISSGQCTITNNQAPTVVPAGNFVLCSGPLSFSALQKTHALGVLLSGSATEEIISQLSSGLLVGSQTCPGAAESLYRLHAIGKQLDSLQACAISYSLLCELSQATPEQKNIPPLISSALAEIHAHYAEVYGIEELANSLGVSKSHLVRTFTASIGISPGKYLTSVRLDAAKRLLLHRQYNLETIASLCGFAGANYFCHVFKKETGQTPLAWRAKTEIQNIPSPEMDELESYLFL